jgi:hypothetical protein
MRRVTATKMALRPACGRETPLLVGGLDALPDARRLAGKAAIADIGHIRFPADHFELHACLSVAAITASTSVTMQTFCSA